MNAAFDKEELHVLLVLKKSRHWCDAEFISKEQLAAIRTQYQSKLYHPNLAIRILLFIATGIAMSGVNGLFFTFVLDLSPGVQGVMALVAGIAAVFFTEKTLIKRNHHYRSGVVESILYWACGYLIGSVGLLTEWNEHALFIFSIVIFLFIAIRFLDLICTGLAVVTVAAFVFYESYELGGVARQLIPFFIIGLFGFLSYILSRLHKEDDYTMWEDNLWLARILCLLLIYAGGNYLVVRECSIALLDMTLEEGQDIPLASLFYLFTALIPILLLYRGVKTRNVLLLRLGALMLCLSILTWKYYHSLVPPELAMTVGGVLVLGLTVWLYSYLKIPRNGFTRERLLSRATVGSNVTAFAVSQTMGGNVTQSEKSFEGGGGSFGGGGSSGDF